jgi:hypothetical protein
MEFEYKLPREDFEKAYKAYYFQKRSTWIFLAITGILFLLGILLLLVDQEFSAGVLCLIPWFPATIYYFFRMPHLLGRKASQNERIAAKVKWELSETEVKISSEFSESNSDWGVFSSVIENKEYFLLFNSTYNAMNIIPKRIFTDKQTEDFRNLVNKKITERKGNSKEHKEFSKTKILILLLLFLAVILMVIYNFTQMKP